MVVLSLPFSHGNMIFSTVNCLSTIIFSPGLRLAAALHCGALELQKFLFNGKGVTYHISVIEIFGEIKLVVIGTLPRSNPRRKAEAVFPA